ncbi:MAG: histidine--tRNA ligase [Eubacterium sp.]|nr:histidine--tRNA ligase [Eubacterium sp.]
MALKKKPTTGMRDILPQEMEIREYVLSMIRQTYRSYGFTQIETPCVEHIENLTGGHGGENEKLIFKILKRGEKLKIDEAKEETDLVDGGLRFDLTVPLVRYYANNASELPAPFKAMQLGNVWRADRPQRGRFRQFMQCDIDVLGDSSNIAETELIMAMATLLDKLEFKDFTIRINDRRILKGIAKYSGFSEEQYDDVFIILDKMDKIGLDGVREELLSAGYPSDSVERFLSVFDAGDGDLEDGSSQAGSDAEISSENERGETGIGRLKNLAGILGDDLENGVADNLREIIDAASGASAEFKLVFDPTLVRGMSYYTGPIFEISMDEYGGSVGGGGRYDTMVGRFLGTEVPAVGFSIGFERIAMLLMERGYRVPGDCGKTAFLIEKKCTPDQVKDVIRRADELRKNGSVVTVDRMKKNKKFQKEQLAAAGYTQIEEVYAD